MKNENIWQNFREFFESSVDNLSKAHWKTHKSSAENVSKYYKSLVKIVSFFSFSNIREKHEILRKPHCTIFKKKCVKVKMEF